MWRVATPERGKPAHTRVQPPMGGRGWGQMYICTSQTYMCILPTWRQKAAKAGPDHGKKIVTLRVHGEIIEPVLFEFMKHIIVCYGVYFVTR